MAESSPSRIPTPVSSLRRSASVRVRGERPLILYSTSPTPFPSISEREEVNHLAESHWAPTRKNLAARSQSQASGLNNRDDDLDSVESFASNISCLSRASSRSNCEHSLFAKNGTTYSARSQKYVVHCSSAGHCSTPEEYLTPTQRANRNARRLKTLLQLAKEKLVEKEKEIFKLTKEVVELNVFKASLKNGSSAVSTPSDCKETSDAICGPATFTVDEVREFPCDSPSKASFCCFDEKIEEETDKGSPREKLSPVSPFHGYQRDKFTATPDYLLSSLADSGQFDDLASSLSIHSKDSLNLHVPSEEGGGTGPSGGDAEGRATLVRMYEALLREGKEAHDDQLSSVKLAHEENNRRVVDSFENKLRAEEQEFERKFKELLKATEDEKIEIVERFERRLEEERSEYMTNLANEKTENGAQTDVYHSDSYLQKVEVEKKEYETSLAEIKSNFEVEREKIEKRFDDAMAAERNKFDSTVIQIQTDYDQQIKLISDNSSDNEKKYNALVEKYEESLAKISELEDENERLKSSLTEQEIRQKELYLKMFMKGQEAVKFVNEDEVVSEPRQPRAVPIPELLVQLKVTEVELENLKDKEYRAQHSDGRGISLISAKEALSLWMLAARKAMYNRLSEAQQRPAAEPPRPPPAVAQPSGQDPEATLSFLKSAVYYFLTDRDNHLEHLRAIESILGFSQDERQDIKTHYVH